MCRALRYTRRIWRSISVNKKKIAVRAVFKISLEFVGTFVCDINLSPDNRRITSTPSPLTARVFYNFVRNLFRKRYVLSADVSRKTNDRANNARFIRHPLFSEITSFGRRLGVLTKIFTYETNFRSIYVPFSFR